MSAAERETIGLCIALEAIDDIANQALLDIHDVRLPWRGRGALQGACPPGDVAYSAA